MSSFDLLRPQSPQSGFFPGSSLSGLSDFSGLGDTSFGFGTVGGMPTTAPSFGSGLGMNVPTAGLALGGLQAIGNLWGAFEANKLAKKQFKFTKATTETNMANQIKSYNTALGDRSRSRAAVEGQSAATAQAYVDKNSMTRMGG